MELKIIEDELKLRGMSKQTIRAYMYWNQRFLEWIRKSPRDVTKSDIESYILYLDKKRLEPATRRLAIAALKFYYCELLKRRFSLKYPRRNKKLLTVLTREEIERMIIITSNLKHKLLIMFLYASGLRVSEAIKLKRSDIFIEENVVKVRQGKGRKDRFVVLSKRFIQCYNEFNNGSEYVFPSNRGGHISARTAQVILIKAARKAGIKKHVHPHALRAAFATHLIENGIDVTFVQKLMGHSRIETTQGYLRLSNASIKNIASPLDY